MPELTFDQLEDFRDRMEVRLSEAVLAEQSEEYRIIVAIIEELLLSREHFGAITEARFLVR